MCGRVFWKNRKTFKYGMCNIRVGGDEEDSPAHVRDRENLQIFKRSGEEEREKVSTENPGTWSSSVL